jgi:formylglycine-generating enzyme required for sulfatase activity
VAPIPHAIPIWANSLGMKFVPLGDGEERICIWETRISDFNEFVARSGFETPQGLYTLESGEWTMTGRTWRDPGFEQAPNHPVCGVSWQMAQTFCSWLTKYERMAGLLPTPSAHYRLPTDAEWSYEIRAAAKGQPPRLGNDYLWGHGYPAPAGTGNFAGQEVLTSWWPAAFPAMPGYRDDFRATAPVGSFPVDTQGIFDLAGNLWEWCEDGPPSETDQRWLRGGSWVDGSRDSLRVDSRGQFPKPTRTAAFGFRIVLAPR